MLLIHAETKIYDINQISMDKKINQNIEKSKVIIEDIIKYIDYNLERLTEQKTLNIQQYLNNDLNDIFYKKIDLLINIFKNRKSLLMILQRSNYIPQSIIDILEKTHICIQPITNKTNLKKNLEEQKEKLELLKNLFFSELTKINETKDLAKSSQNITIELFKLEILENETKNNILNKKLNDIIQLYLEKSQTEE